MEVMQCFTDRHQFFIVEFTTDTVIVLTSPGKEENSFYIGKGSLYADLYGPVL